MAPLAPSTAAASSPELRRKRTAAAPPPRSPPEARRFCSISDVLRRARPVDAPPPLARARHQMALCGACGAGDRDEELLLCDICDRGRHTFCLRPILPAVPLGPWFCPDCVPTSINRFPLKQSKIVDFFRIEKGAEGGAVRPAKSGLSQDAKRRRRRSIVMHKKKRRLLPFVPTEDRVRRLEQMASAATALTSSKMEFSNELTYVPNMAPISANQAKLEEGGMQVLSREDKETIELCRSMLKRGECPPLLVVFDSHEGFTVKADACIKDLTFLTEYTGDVDYLKNRENDGCDSIMTLLSPVDPAQKLVICPDKRGNIARFINGINNHTPDGKKKQNVKCVRYDIDGECHVLLVACRDIARGEKLYYDYNGHEYAYPTHHFV
ncbi:probable Histone-lysine N-methyltransferase ATXR5 [Hordeum vulgare subsp. vulgare]|uniref:[histone H3]-lysine(27) N-methyltransferase n=1 Tax=Hordeum vulgare subsp. vulgare TaxID=112509 RepID=A0A8I6XUZ0_HORVV|nr:probable Histone-lysine N-methyltransferase ATXR5 [Hordeum vulgare subsp. vulgare]